MSRTARKGVTVTLPETAQQNIRVYWQRRDGKPGNSPMFPHRQKDVVKGEVLGKLAVTVDPELAAAGEPFPEKRWVIVHMPTHKRFFWEGEPLRLGREEALVLAAELEAHFDWGFDSVGCMDEWVEERARVLIRRAVGGRR